MEVKGSWACWIILSVSLETLFFQFLSALILSKEIILFAITTSDKDSICGF